MAVEERGTRKNLKVLDCYVSYYGHQRMPLRTDKQESKRTNKEMGLREFSKSLSTKVTIRAKIQIFLNK